MLKEAVSGTTLLGQPQILTTGGCLAGASPAGHSCNISHEAEKQDVQEETHVEDIPHDIELVFRADLDPRSRNTLPVK